MSADVSRMDFTDRRDHSNSGRSQSQCTPMPLPALGTQRIIQGNGTNVGTVISLQCPARHKLVGSELKCVMDVNSTRWVGENYCKPLSHYEDFGFRVAVLASIVSSVVILLMSMAFIACCLLDCIKEDERKRQEREADALQWEEQDRGENGYLCRHKVRNSNNNNSKEKGVSLWDARNPVLSDCSRVCRYHEHHEHHACGPASTRPPAPLPGLDYEQPLIPQNAARLSGQYLRHPPASCQTPSPGLLLVSAEGAGVVWQQNTSLSRGKPTTTDEPNSRNVNKECSIRIISV